jgi:hypothetical protein
MLGQGIECSIKLSRPASGRRRGSKQCIGKIARLKTPPAVWQGVHDVLKVLSPAFGHRDPSS